MEELYTSVTGAHLSTRKLVFSLFACVWLPKIRASISRFIFACYVCKRIKNFTSLPTGLWHPFLISTPRFTSWSMDFVTGFPLSQGYNAIFVYVDCLTKYIKSIPCFMGEDLLRAEKVVFMFF